MPTPHRTYPDVPPRTPLRLRLSPGPGATLAGAWWPQTRDLATELADLVEHFPPRVGRITRALYSPPDWDHALRRVPVGDRYVKTGSFPRDDTHLMLLTLSDRRVLELLVVPDDFTNAQGVAAMRLATTSSSRRAPVELLAAARSGEAPESASTDHDPDEPWRSWIPGADASRN